MSYSDFLIIPGLGDNSAGGFTGSAVLNSAFGTPLTSSVQCRGYKVNNEQVDTRGMFFVSSSVSGGLFVNIPETKSVSLRCWYRTTSDSGNESGITLLAKHNGYNTFRGNPSGSITQAGYEFGNNRNDNCFTRKLGGYTAGPFVENISNTTSPDDVWIGLRMDIVPVRVNRLINGVPTSSSLKDIVSMYTASVSAPDTWLKVYEEEILTTSGRYVPWGSYNTVPTASYGFMAVTSVAYAPNGKTYFDDFQIFIEDAF